MMYVYVVGDWRDIAIRGIATVAFGILTLIWPDITVTVLVLLFGIYALIAGASMLLSVARREPETTRRRGIVAFMGALGVAAGIITLAWPDITALALLWVIAAWALLIGALQIIAAVRLRSVLRNEWLLGLAGVATVVFAILLAITPGTGALVITWLIAWYAIFVGILLLALAWRLRRLEAPRGGATSFGEAAV
jgi:uncharacterized membrane protein HdeD (DUF308 family)